MPPMKVGSVPAGGTGGGAGGMGGIGAAGAAVASNRVPQFPQNCAPTGLAVPQLGQFIGFLRSLDPGSRRH
jgi:hypothetical protein